jgi:hypothetical protein
MRWLRGRLAWRALNEADSSRLPPATCCLTVKRCAEERDLRGRGLRSLSAVGQKPPVAAGATLYPPSAVGITLTPTHPVSVRTTQKIVIFMGSRVCFVPRLYATEFFSFYFLSISAMKSQKARRALSEDVFYPDHPPVEPPCEQARDEEGGQVCSGPISLNSSKRG